MDTSELICLLGKKYTIDILSLLNEDSMKYSEIQTITTNPRTTNIRLKQMVEEGLIERRILNDNYRSVVYCITEKGKRILSKINELEKL